MTMHRIRLATLVVAASVMAPMGIADAQQQPQLPAAQQRPPARQGTKAAAPKEVPRAAETALEAQLKGRVEHLEEQLADMQVVIGTLESLGRGGQSGGIAGSTARPTTGGGGGGGVDTARLDSLETQIRALSSQMEQVAAQVRQPAGNRRSDSGAPPVGGAVGMAAGAGIPPVERQTGLAPPVEGAPSGFGSTTVTQGERGDPIGRMLGTDAPQNASAAPPARLPPSAAGATNPRELYETAYGYLLQQDYGAAEVAFEEFLRRYPSDRLAADAQYWLGETLYVQRRYKPAGQAFLTVVEKHKTSAKVPNSLLKLAQSLEQLGQKDCGIFTELETRHPNAPADVRVKARAMKQRQGC